jgi:cytochrome c5
MGTRGRGWMLAGLCAGMLLGCEAEDRDEGPGTGQQTTPAGGDALLLAAARVALPPPMAAADLPDPQSQGAQLTAQFCGGACHGIPAPSAHSATDWPVVLRRMWLRAGKLDTAALHVAVPDNAQRIVISEYMIANALKVSAGTLPDFPGRDQYVATCGRCHGLPDARQHSAQDWASVVRRMNTRMETMLKEALTPDQIQRVVMYLERASAGG